VTSAHGVPGRNACKALKANADKGGRTFCGKDCWQHEHRLGAAAAMELSLETLMTSRAPCGADEQRLSVAGRCVALVRPVLPCVALWPHLRRVPGAADGFGLLLGVTSTTTQMYSGGGADASELRQIRIISGGTGLQSQEVMRIALSGGSTIRACFLR
jgi:hypothetical protein